MKGLPLIALLMLGVMVALAYPATSEQITVTAEVPTYVSVVFNYNTVSFGTVQLGTTDYPAPGNSQGLYNVTVVSNTYVNISIVREPWSPYDYLILKFARGTTIPTNPEYEVATSPQQVGGMIFGSFTDYHAYWLTAPAWVPAGSYSTTVTITYLPA